MFGIVERLRHERPLSPSKANVAVDSLIRMTKGSVSHIDESNKYLVRDVHTLSRLSLRVEDSPNSGFMVYRNFE